MSTKKFIELDVREDLRLKKEPFDKIMGAVKQLEDGQALVLHAPFNPVPLHAVLKRKGFTHEAEKVAKKHWKVTYIKKGVE
ncbi:DUF2249 domain-containing protein [Virgibacillus dakarensis]|uniref:DUF2249 domain-containing protein n=1 Tax=Lentibacillus populi TaxID=1827502 RepID=A0A9W5TX08_9BACI|nr:MULTISPECIES: DUF2249 domain-containing protein [Bacillaceae]MBT2215396.1 DUF2249 domain-containing protein [Virgibacillus dakarensis]MTW85435.1 DUF2249 domain-containing protein [Virgibacillus dakarensis]GGB39854.1 hypothetical protein GCM10011409_16720 [Lentibacillus populi]